MVNDWLFQLSCQKLHCTYSRENVPSVGADSLDVFISSLDEELEIGTAAQLSKFFALQKCLRPKSIGGEMLYVP